MPSMNFDIETYKAWTGITYVVITQGKGRAIRLSRDDARELRDLLTNELVQITEDEEKES